MSRRLPLFVFSFFLAAGLCAKERTIRVGLAVRKPLSALKIDKQRGLLNGRRYRGRLSVLPAGNGKVTVINIVPLEDYLRSVVPSEMPHSWPAEALKAQAVVARSYALANMGQYGKDGYDICATASCQVYRGMESEHRSTDKAVKDTKGEYLTYKGAQVSAVFHSSCGGRTDDSSDVWKGDRKPYLKGVRSKWCREESPHSQWEAKIPDKEMDAALRAAGYDLGRVKHLRIVSRTKAGRAYEVRVTGTKGGETFPGNRFRLIVGSQKIRSTLWSGLSHRDGVWCIHGRGWGHGVGLCQWCAKITAGYGYKHREILAYFYRSTKVRAIDP